jgi:hypothetical protein
MEGCRGLRPEVGTRSRRYGDVPRCTGGNGGKAAAKDATMNEMRNDLVEDCRSHGKGNKVSKSGVSGVGRRSWRDSDVMRHTRGNHRMHLEKMHP